MDPSLIITLPAHILSSNRARSLVGTVSANYRVRQVFKTHWGRGKMAAIPQTTFSNTFSWLKMFNFPLKFHWNLFLWVQLIIFHHWFTQWLGAKQATSHYLNQYWPMLWTHICVTQPQCVKSFFGDQWFQVMLCTSCSVFPNVCHWWYIVISVKLQVPIKHRNNKIGNQQSLLFELPEISDMKFGVKSAEPHYLSHHTQDNNISIMKRQHRKIQSSNTLKPRT